MSEPLDPPANELPSLPPPVFYPSSIEPPRTRFYPLAFSLALLAWCIIVFWVLGEVFFERGGGGDEVVKHDDNNSLQLVIVRFQARLILGMRELTRTFDPGNEQQLSGQVSALNTGPPEQRLRYAILVGELSGPYEALISLEQLDGLVAKQKLTLTPTQIEQRDILRRLYSDYVRLRFDAPDVTPAERAKLKETMGWFGALALTPDEKTKRRDQLEALAGVAVAGAAPVAEVHPSPDAANRPLVLQPALRVVWVSFIALGTALAGGLMGFCGIWVVIILLMLGKSRGGLTCGISPTGVYVETFALWALLLLLLHRLDSRALANVEWRLLLVGLIEIGTLCVLFWPVLRGVPWRRVREDIGLTLGRRPAAEPALGVASYFMGLPVLFAGIIGTLILMGLQRLLIGDGGGGDEFANPTTPSHPIMGPLLRGDWTMHLQIFFLASFVAPLVEEIMFRGVLYRHLRELSRRTGMVISVLFSTLLSSFIFAAIHPQGLLAVPALMALAIVFCLVREWRGTLIPCMVAHGFSNGLVLFLNILLMGE